MTRIHFRTLKTNVIQSNSGIYYGKNVHYQWKKKSRSDEGFGSVLGNSNKIVKNNSYVTKKKQD